MDSRDVSLSYKAVQGLVVRINKDRTDNSQIAWEPSAGGQLTCRCKPDMALWKDPACFCVRAVPQLVGDDLDDHSRFSPSFFVWFVFLHCKWTKPIARNAEV